MTIAGPLDVAVFAGDRIGEHRVQVAELHMIRNRATVDVPAPALSGRMLHFDADPTELYRRIEVAANRPDARPRAFRKRRLAREREAVVVREGR